MTSTPCIEPHCLRIQTFCQIKCILDKFGYILHQWKMYEHTQIIYCIYLDQDHIYSSIQKCCIFRIITLDMRSIEISFTEGEGNGFESRLSS